MSTYTGVNFIFRTDDKTDLVQTGNNDVFYLPNLRTTKGNMDLCSYPDGCCGNNDLPSVVPHIPK